MKPLLTIAIPTFNRADRLKRCLEACLEQTAGKSVELLVSDNASEDATQAFMTEFCKKNLAVSYVRNPENIGPDRNFLNCYNCAKGEYVLLLGDDDVLLPGAVDAILEAKSICGMEKLMWGSDYPRTMTAITYRMSQDFITKSDKMTEADKKLFLGENAKSFYRFGDLPEIEYTINMVE